MYLSIYLALYAYTHDYKVWSATITALLSVCTIVFLWLNPCRFFLEFTGYPKHVVLMSTTCFTIGTVDPTTRVMILQVKTSLGVRQCLIAANVLGALGNTLTKNEYVVTHTDFRTTKYSLYHLQHKPPDHSAYHCKENSRSK